MALLRDMTRTVLTEAVRMYLEEAYGGAALPPAVQARLEWPAGSTLEELAGAEVFELTPDDTPLRQCDRVRLRLGNREYPHMKLGADRIPDSEEWVLAVDCHDRQLLTIVPESERAALEALLRRNNELKTRIERRWTEAGLPTFERYIRGRLAAADGA
jgi:hypothetical protein